MPQIYVIYRPEDTRKKSRDIIAVLEKTYGASNTHSPDYAGYVDVYAIERDVKQADYLLVIIGNYWSDMVDESGMNLLNSVYDPVHMAIATGINSRKQVIPILVDGASMPYANRLPRELRKLTKQDPIKLNKNDPLEKSLTKGLKEIIKQGSRLKIPSFVSQVKKPVKTPPAQIRQRRQAPQSNRPSWIIRAVWVAIVLVVTAIIMAFLLMPTSWESAVTSPSEAVNQVVAEVTAIPPTDIPPTLIVPTEMPALAKITVDNASQLTQTDRIASLSPTELVLFSQDQKLFIFLSRDLQEVTIEEISTGNSIVVISTAPLSPLAIEYNEDETELLILLSDGRVGVWGVPTE
jgi:hypothetical protein